MKKVIKSVFLVCLVSLSLTTVAQTEEFGVMCEKGFHHVPQEEMIEFYKDVLKDVVDIKGAKFGPVMLSKRRDTESGEVIIFLFTKAQLSGGGLLDINSRVYITPEGMFSLNEPGSDELSVTACKTSDTANPCAAKLTSKGGICEGGKDCQKISVVASLDTICK